MDSPSSRPNQHRIRQRYHQHSGPSTMDTNEGTELEGGVDRAGGHIDRYHSLSSDRHTNMQTSGSPISRHHWQYLFTTLRGITGRRSGTAAIYTRNSTNPAPTGKSGNNKNILQKGAPETPAARVRGVPLRTHPTCREALIGQEDILIDITVPVATDTQTCKLRVLQYHAIIGSTFAQCPEVLREGGAVLQQFYTRNSTCSTSPGE
jgi:hypothetical protein